MGARHRCPRSRPFSPPHGSLGCRRPLAVAGVGRDRGALAVDFHGCNDRRRVSWRGLVAPPPGAPDQGSATTGARPDGRRCPRVQRFNGMFRSHRSVSRCSMSSTLSMGCTGQAPTA
eukprot:scaffold1594_cov401-Prasinococcus_capsulatus_cf.AAC.62